MHKLKDVDAREQDKAHLRQTRHKNSIPCPPPWRRSGSTITLIGVIGTLLCCCQGMRKELSPFSDDKGTTCDEVIHC